MQEKLIDILSRATAWMTDGEIAEAGNWRSHANVGIALQQIERSTGNVERRKSPTKKMRNGMPETEWKLTEKTIAESTETKMGRKPKHPPLEPAVVRESRTTEMPSDKECCNAAKVVATTASQEVAELRNRISDLELDANRMLEYLGEKNQRIESLEADQSYREGVIADLNAKLGHARIQIDALNDQLMHGEEAVDVKDAARGYLVCAPKRKPAKLMKADSAVERAKAAAKATGRSELFALVPVGVATRKRMNVIVFQELAA